MHHACCASCLVYVWCVYYVVCFFSIVPVLLRSWGFVRLHFGSASSVRLLHGLVLLPCGTSGKMTATLDLTTIISMLVASFYRYAASPIICSSSLPNCHEPLTFDTFPMQTIVWLCSRICSAPLIALLVAGEDEDCSMLDYVYVYVGISQYLLYY